MILLIYLLLVDKVARDCLANRKAQQILTAPAVWWQAHFRIARLSGLKLCANTRYVQKEYPSENWIIHDPKRCMHFSDLFDGCLCAFPSSRFSTSAYSATWKLWTSRDPWPRYCVTGKGPEPTLPLSSSTADVSTYSPAGRGGQMNTRICTRLFENIVVENCIEIAAFSFQLTMLRHELYDSKQPENHTKDKGNGKKRRRNWKLTKPIFLYCGLQSSMAPSLSHINRAESFWKNLSYI